MLQSPHKVIVIDAASNDEVVLGGAGWHDTGTSTVVDIDTYAL
ncbi:hypothetical protein [Limnohabitans sp. 2KL-17]|nr:hypothetical protein [Limnohabitans sp. 2KL-17]